MAISLQKGQRIDLTKGKPGLSGLLVGLGWDPVKKSGGILGGLFGAASADIDCDASVLLLNDQNKLEDIVYFGKKKSKCGSINHSGDNLTGEGDGDDEQIQVNLNEIPSHVHKLVFVVNIYHCVQRKQDFGMIQNAYIRIEDSSNHTELVKYNLSDDYNELTTIYPGELYRQEEEWKFSAVGEGTSETSIDQIVNKYRA